MRLGQLVHNLAARPYGLERRDPFYVEDNVLQWDEVPVSDPQWEGGYREEIGLDELDISGIIKNMKLNDTDED